MQVTRVPAKSIFRRNPLKNALLIAGLAAALVPASAWAQTTSTWTSNSDTNWGSSANWNNGVPLTSSAFRAFLVSTSGTANPNIATSATTGNLTITGSFTLSASPSQSLTLTGTGTTNTTAALITTGSTNTISAPLIFGGNGVQWIRNNATGGGPLTLSGNITKSDSADLQISAGTTITVSGNMSVAGKVVSVAGSSILSGSNSAGSWDLGGGGFTLNSAGALGSSGAINWSGAGQLVFTANNTTDYSSRFTVSSNQSYSVGAASGQTVTLASALAGSGTGGFIAGNTTNSGNTGTIILGNSGNSFSGSVFVNGGALSVAGIGNEGNNSHLGTSGTINFGTTVTSGSLIYTGNGETSNKVINLRGTTGGATIQADNASGLLKFTSALTVTGSGAKTLTLSGSGAGEFAGAIVNYTGAGGPLATSLTKSNAGIWTLSGNNTYTGTTEVNAGVLLLENANALPGGIGSTGGISALTISGGVIGLGNGDFTRGLGTGATQVQITGGGGFAAYGATRTVNLGGQGTPTSLTWGSGNFITSAGNFILGASSATHMVDFQNPIALGSAVRTVQVNRGSGDVDARLSGVLTSSGSTGGLTKTGAGVLEITAVNTYSGTTAINAGRFLVSSAGDLSNTARVVVNGSGADFRWNSSTAFTRPLTMTQGTISGTGTISANGGVSIGTGAILSPGNSPGIQAYTTSLAWAPGGTYQWELNSLTGTAGPNWDLVNVTSGTFSLAGLSSVPGNQFVLDLTTLAAGDAAGQLVNPYDGGSYTFAIASYNPANFLLPGGFSNTAGADLTSLFTINLGNWQGAQPEAGNVAVKINSTATGIDLVIVPEPGAIALAGIGIAAAAYALRRRRT